MLDLPRYLLGVVEVLLLAGFATLGASAIRSRVLPSFEGAPDHLVTAVLALVLLIWPAELLGTLGILDPLPLLLVAAVLGVGLWTLLRRVAWGEGGRGRPRPQRPPRPMTGPAGRSSLVPITVALLIAALAILKFALETKTKLGTGMTGFDSTWYHGPFAAGFFQSGDTWGLHYIAPQFLAWFYPANSELLHATGMLAFDRDLLSPLLNLGWFAGCLLACWCIGRPYRVAPWSLALGAVALSVPAFADQAGEARNDIVGTFFLLAAVATVLNAQRGTQGSSVRTYDRIAGKSANALMVAGLAAGLAAGTKLTFLLPAAVLVLGLAVVAPAGTRWRSLLLGGLAALAGGGYWYLRNLAHSGNPLPWFDDLGPIPLPAPDQPLGGREGHSVLGYLFDGQVWSDWLLPGLHDGLSIAWPLLLVAAFSGLLFCLGRRAGPELRLAGAVGLAAAFAWLVAPTSASGPEGMPRGFESGLRYLAPALALGLAVLPTALLPRVARWRGPPMAEGVRRAPEHMGEGRRDRTRGPLIAALVVLAAIAIGYPVQRHYLKNRYADPSFAAPGLNAAFAWASSVHDSRIATTGTRQYPLFGSDLSNQVQFIGIERPHGGFTAPTTCSQWRRLLNAGDYDYVIATRDRLEPGKPPYPPTARWTKGPEVRVILRQPPTVVFELRKERFDPSMCR
jgi:hypothetical protein